VKEACELVGIPPICLDANLRHLGKRAKGRMGRSAVVWIWGNGADTSLIVDS
jgi:hypothetical protein